MQDRSDEKDGSIQFNPRVQSRVRIDDDSLAEWNGWIENDTLNDLVVMNLMWLVVCPLDHSWTCQLFKRLNDGAI